MLARNRPNQNLASSGVMLKALRFLPATDAFKSEPSRAAALPEFAHIMKLVKPHIVLLAFGALVASSFLSGCGKEEAGVAGPPEVTGDGSGNA